jgi:hypothetical protein
MEPLYFKIIRIIFVTNKRNLTPLIFLFTKNNTTRHESSLNFHGTSTQQT